VLRLSVKQREGATALDDLRQEGSLKARFPRPENGAWMTAVTLNSSGGVAQGDSLDVEIGAGPGACLTVAAQAAERFYRAPLGDNSPAVLRTVLSVGPGASLEWLPQETILFDGCVARRRLEVELHRDSRFLGVETLVFGRAAMGERLRSASWRDVVAVRRAGRLILHDAIRLEGAASDRLARPALAAGARAVATIVYAGSDAAERLDALREALAPFQAGASAFDGLLVARVVAADGAYARAAVVAGSAALRGGRPPPRVWSC
jgi:urease accessory protein